MLTVIGLTLSLSLAPAGSVQSTGSAPALPVLPPGIHNQTLSRAGAPPIRYAIVVPPGYSAAARVPLILSLHFGGDPVGAGRSMLDILIQPALADLGAIIIAPDSLGGGWNTEQNEEAVQALLGAVLQSYSVDPRKVIVTGFSMGGSGTWYWANKFPERFSAAIPMAGRPVGDPSTWRVPIFAVHSQDDELVPIGPAQKQIDDLKRLGKNAEIVVVRGITHYQTDLYVDALRRAVPWLRNLWK